DAGVARLACTHGSVERAHGLLKGGVRIEAVRIEDVDVVKAHPLEALLETAEQVLAGTPFAVRAGPHGVAGLSRDHEPVAVGPEVLGGEASEIDPRAAVGRARGLGETRMGAAG